MTDITQSEVWKLAEIAMAAQRTYRVETEAAKYEAHTLKIEVERLKAENSRLANAKYESDAAIDVLTKTIKRLAAK